MCIKAQQALVMNKIAFLRSSIHGVESVQKRCYN